MITTIYYTLAAAAYSIFLIQFILSLFGGDLDVDVDSDIDTASDADNTQDFQYGVSWSDIFSFKGLVHFLMGFAGWLSLAQYTRGIVWTDYLIAVALGFSFIFILLSVAQFLYNFRHEPSGKNSTDLIGLSGYISIIGNDGKPDKDGDYEYYMVLENGDTYGQEVKIYSKSTNMDLGSHVTINKVENEKYYI